MRIIYVLTSLGMGGAERQALSLAEAMAARGHTVAVLVLRPHLAEEWPTSLPVCSLGLRRSPVSLLRGLLRARRFLCSFRPSLLHSHSFHANLFTRLLRLCAPAPAVVSTVHNVYEGGWPRMLAYRLSDPLSRRTVTVSQAAAERFIRLHAIPARKCLVLPNAIDPDGLAPNPARRAATRAQLGLGAEFLWLAAGRLVPAKDYPNLLRAFAELRAIAPQARLVLAGELTPLAPALQALAGRLGLADSVRWLGLRRDLPALLDAADGFVLSSAWEGMPLVLAEAMAMEKPAVATNVGGVQELLGRAGRLVPPHQPPALAQAMLACMNDPAEARQAQGRAARQRIVTHFNLATRAAAWESLYRSLIRPAR